MENIGNTTLHYLEIFKTGERRRFFSITLGQIGLTNLIDIFQDVSLSQVSSRFMCCRLCPHTDHDLSGWLLRHRSWSKPISAFPTRLSISSVRQNKSSLARVVPLHSRRHFLETPIGLGGCDGQDNYNDLRTLSDFG